MQCMPVDLPIKLGGYRENYMRQQVVPSRVCSNRTLGVRGEVKKRVDDCSLRIGVITPYPLRLTPDEGGPLATLDFCWLRIAVRPMGVCWFLFSNGCSQPRDRRSKSVNMTFQPESLWR